MNDGITEEAARRRERLAWDTTVAYLIAHTGQPFPGFDSAAERDMLYPLTPVLKFSPNIWLVSVYSSEDWREWTSVEASTYDAAMEQAHAMVLQFWGRCAVLPNYRVERETY